MNSEENKEYSVNWKNHMSHVRKAFDNLLTSSELTDVTLCCEGKKIGAHKMLLSACSNYFRDTFKDVPCQHPVIILYGVEFTVLTDILRFIYNGEVSVDTSKLDSFLKTAQLLQISGLTDDSSTDKTLRGLQQNVEEPQAQEQQQSYTEPAAPPTSTSEEPKRGQKRLRTKEEAASTNKIVRQDTTDTLFVSDVKCEPSELVNFEDPLEDPLLQSEQSNDTHEFFETGQAGVEEEFKIEIDENVVSERFGNESVVGLKKNVPLNTIKNKSSTWSSFRKFCRERKYTLNENTSVEQLSEILADWGLNMRRADGTDYKESVVKQFWNRTANMLQEMYYEKYRIKIDPFRGIEFKKARDARDIKRSQLKNHPDKRHVSSAVLTEAERNLIAATYDENTPSGLQRKFYLIAVSYLAWKGTEAAHCLVHYFQEEVDLNGTFTGRIFYNPQFATGSSSITQEIRWLVANNENQDLCPVRLFYKLLDKRNTNNHLSTDRLFLSPNPNWNKKETSSWYSNSPVGRNMISTWAKEAAEKIRIDTNRFKVTSRSFISSATSTSSNVQIF